MEVNRREGWGGGGGGDRGLKERRTGEGGGGKIRVSVGNEDKMW